MVSKQTHKSKALENNKTGKILFLTLLAIFVATFTVILGFLAKFLTSGEELVEPSDNIAEVNDQNINIEDVEKVEAKELPEKIDFQGLIDEWTGSVGGNKSVLIYDLEREEEVGAYNTKENYNTASLYKLFVVYEGYRRVDSGEWNGDDIAGYTGKTINECLDLAIRESNSVCAETLWGMIGRSELDEIIRNDFKITNSKISSLISNPEDIMEMLKIFYEHKEIKSEELIKRMVDSFLNQPTTTYNWRQGLPSGFSKAKVYNKVGWDYNPDGKYWNIYHDAAIVEFPEDERHFIVIVMTNRVPFQDIRRFGESLEKFYYNS